MFFPLSSVKEVKRKLEKVLKSKTSLSKSMEIFGKQRLTDQWNEKTMDNLSPENERSVYT